MHKKPNDDWDEFEWELSLRESDQFAARYFRLLRRFCDLPGANELIAKHMGRDFEATLPDCDFNCEQCEHRWTCEFAASLEWPADADEEERDSGPDDPEPEATAPAEPGDSYYFESDPTFVLLRQAAIGWCNIYAAILPPEARPRGLRILFHIGRSLANLGYSIGDGLYEQPAASVAFGKRSLDQLNRAVGLVNQLIQERPRLRKILGTIRHHLIRATEKVTDHLQRCRNEPNAKAG